MGRLVSCLLVFSATTPLLAGPIELVIDETQSSANVSMCLTVTSTACGADVSPLGGTVVLSLDCPAAPAEATLHDFVVQMVDDVVLTLNYGLQGRFAARGSNVQLEYADPGTPLPPTDLVGDQFSYSGVPILVDGQLVYGTSGFICTAFTFSGYDCDGTIELNEISVQPITIDGMLTVSGDDISVVIDMSISGPIDPGNPSLGSLQIDATLVADGTIPAACCPGDLTGDDRVEAADVGKLVGCLAGPSEGAAGACQCADLDGDDAVDLADVAEFQLLFEGS